MELLLYIVPIILVLGAQALVSGTYRKYRVVSNSKKLSGFDVARHILDKNNLKDIKVVEVKGTMSDHYDPKRKVVRLSSEVYHDSTIASAAIAAHECGHVMQHNNKYTPMLIRSAIVPFVNFASYIGYVILIIGIVASIFDLAILGIILLSATLVFQLITLPVEFNASKRAIKTLETERLIEKSEKSSVKAMLSAAAFTYVASLLANLLEILRLFLMASRSRDWQNAVKVLEYTSRNGGYVVNNYIQQFIEIDKRKIKISANSNEVTDTELTLCIMFGVIAICLLISVNSYINIADTFNNVVREIIDFFSSVSHYLHLDEMAKQIGQLF